MKMLKLARIVATTLAMAAGVAQATLYSSWEVTDNVVFDTASVVPAGNTYPNPVFSNSDQSLRWGIPYPNELTDLQSGLDINDNFTPLTTLLGVANTTVAVTHLNHPILAPSLSSVDILANIVLNPTGYTPPPNVVDGNITFKIKFIETTNQPGPICADGTANNTGINAAGCADIFVINNEETNFDFVLEDYRYFVSFIGTGFTPLSNAACLAAGATSGCKGFQTAENQDTTAFFQLQIDAERIVPEPGSLALIGLGLLGVGVARRRKLVK